MLIAAEVGGTKGEVEACEGPFMQPIKGSRIRFPMTKEEESNFEQDYQELLGACKKLEAQYGKADMVCLSAAGFPDKHRQKLIMAGNICDWEEKPIVAQLSHDMDCPVRFGGDAEAAGMAEAVYGLNQEDDFFLVIWGTGVGGCFIRFRNGLIIPLRGEFGHQTNRPRFIMPSFRCGCGRINCLEAIIGGGHHLRNFRAEGNDIPGDVWMSMAQIMAFGIGNTLMAQPVPRLVFSGGVICKQEWLMFHIHQMLVERLGQLAPVTVELSVFGESAGLVGATALSKMV